MNLSEIVALAGGSAGIVVLFAVAVAPWLAAHAQTGASGPARATPFVPSPRRPLPVEAPSSSAAVRTGPAAPSPRRTPRSARSWPA